MSARRLVLIRHAKATAHGGVDIERPLADRGVEDAREIGQWMARNALAPERVVVSPARRTLQTWRLTSAQLPNPPTVTVDERIYANSVGDLLAVVAETPASVSALALVGHNPSMHQLATQLAIGDDETPTFAALRERYPTGAVAVFDVDATWSDVTPETATLTAFVVCRGRPL